jgi:hypothetical protein
MKVQLGMVDIIPGAMKFGCYCCPATSVDTSSDQLLFGRAGSGRIPQPVNGLECRAFQGIVFLSRCWNADSLLKYTKKDDFALVKAPSSELESSKDKGPGH